MVQLDFIYVINVKKFTQRRVFMEKQLAKAGLQAEFILDWDADELTEDIIGRYFAGGNKLSAAQKSCSLKHICALQKVAENNGKFNLILEDDAVFLKAFNEGIQRALSESERFTENKVIYIGSGSGGNFRIPKSQRKPGQHLYLGERGRYADSYIIDSATAKKRLDWIMQNKVSIPIDLQFDKIDRLLDIKIVWLENPVVEQGSKTGRYDTTIEAPPSAWLRRLFFNIKRVKRKYIYQLWR